MAKSLHSVMVMCPLFLIYVSLASLPTKSFSSTQSLCHDDERAALFQFKQSISIHNSASSDPHAYPKIASWKLNGTESNTSDCCLWDGVQCSLDSGHVIGLNLSSSCLHGSINSSSSLFRLVHLQRINLADNDFSGPLPVSLNNLIQLTTVDFGYNGFIGHIPSMANLSQLITVDLGHNGFIGHIPSMANLSQLTYLSLSSNKFERENLPNWLGKLTGLTYLYLDDCNLYGEIPSSLATLTQLRELDLGHNGFIGHIPSMANLSQLTYLSLSSNKFERENLPNWLGKLTGLTYLYLDDCNLYGEIPSSLATLTQLRELDLNSNHLVGHIPSFLMSLTQLTFIDLSSNQFQGPIPSSFSNLNNLEFVGLEYNNFSGTVEVDIFLKLKKLNALQLGENMISLSVTNNYTNVTLPKFNILGLAACNLRAFPEFLRFQDEMVGLFLEHNRIEGQIPEWMWNTSKETLETVSFSDNLLMGFDQNPHVLPWVDLKILNLEHNMLQGLLPIPSPNTRIFKVSNNRLTGEISPSICQLNSLQMLDLSNNNMTGIIPPCLGNFSNSLTVLNLQGNKFKGTIPDTYTKESKLKMINFRENQLEGKVPRSLGNCFELQILDLGDNHVDDRFPFWLGALSELQVLILRSNKFHGEITFPTTVGSGFPKLHIIDLSDNGFRGDLPQKWSAMKMINADAIYMQTEASVKAAFSSWNENYSYSMIIGNKGITLDYLRILNEFTVIDLSSNKFRGEIPESVGNLRGLNVLNLSNNCFTGRIPASLGNLTWLESLDLSRNMLSGEIPQQLEQLDFLEFLNVSCNHLIGPIPQGKQFHTFQNNSYERNPGLCGEPLSKKCNNSHVWAPPPGKVYEYPSDLIWMVVLLGYGSGLVVGLIVGQILTARYHEWFVEKFGRREKEDEE